jgi:hypothetical protein
MRQIAVVRDYDTLVDALRARRDELKITHAVIDDVSGLHSGYASKLMSDPPIKGFGRVSLGPILGSLGLQLLVVVDPEGFKRVRSRLDERVRPKKMLPIGSIPWLFNRLNAVEMNKKRVAKVTKKRRRQIARKAAKVRWHKPQISEIEPKLPASKACG